MSTSAAYTALLDVIRSTVTAPGPAAVTVTALRPEPAGEGVHRAVFARWLVPELVHRWHPALSARLRQRPVGLHRIPLPPRGANRSGGRSTGPRDRAGASESGRADTSEPRRHRHPPPSASPPRLRRRGPMVVRRTPAPWREHAGHLHAGRLAAVGLSSPPGPRARHHLRLPPWPHRHPQPHRRRAGHADSRRPRLRERRRRLLPPAQETRRRRADAEAQQTYNEAIRGIHGVCERANSLHRTTSKALRRVSLII